MNGPSPEPGPAGDRGVTVAVVGVGLIGGSVALAAKERLGATVVGWDADAGALAAASGRGAIDVAARDLAAAVAGRRRLRGRLLGAVPTPSRRSRPPPALTAWSPTWLNQGAQADRFSGDGDSSVVTAAGAATAGIDQARADP